MRDLLLRYILGRNWPATSCVLKVTPKILRLERDTIVEVIFEIRFQGINKTVADLLPGILFGAFKDKAPKSLSMPSASLPREVQYSDDSLRYLPRHGLEIGSFRILVGDHSCLVSNRSPYAGWERFKPMILDVLDRLQSSQLIALVERCSLKYLNIIEGKGSFEEQFSHVNFSAALSKRDLTQLLTIVRTEIREQGLLTIVELSPGTTVERPGSSSVEGLLVSVDTINTDVENFWINQEGILERTHDVEKSIYFDMLTKETLNTLGPIYEGSRP